MSTQERSDKGADRPQLFDSSDVSLGIQHLLRYHTCKTHASRLMFPDRARFFVACSVVYSSQARAPGTNFPSSLPSLLIKPTLLHVISPRSRDAFLRPPMDNLVFGPIVLYGAGNTVNNRLHAQPSVAPFPLHRTTRPQQTPHRVRTNMFRPLN